MSRLLSLYKEVLDEDNKARTKTLANVVNKIRLQNEEKTLTTGDLMEFETFGTALNNLVEEVSLYMNSLLLTKETITSGTNSGDKVYKDNVEALIKLSRAYNQVGRILRKIYQKGKGSTSEVRILKDELSDTGVIENMERIQSDLNDLQVRTGLYTKIIPFVNRMYIGIQTAQFPELSNDKYISSISGLSREEAKQATIKKYEARERQGELIPDVLKELGIKDDALSLKSAADNNQISEVQAEELFNYYRYLRDEAIENNNFNEARKQQYKIRAIGRIIPPATLNNLDDDELLPPQIALDPEALDQNQYALVPNTEGFGRSGGSQSYNQNDRTERFPARKFTPIQFNNAELRRFEV
jgi:hypothetical protein